MPPRSSHTAALLIVVVLGVAGCAAIGAFVALHPAPLPAHAALETAGTTTVVTIATSTGAGPSFDTAPAPIAPAHTKPGVVTAPKNDAPERAPQEMATLTVDSSSYKAPLTASHTVLDMMRALADQDHAFTFAGREYPSLGFFVTAIDGKAAQSGYNWMLYVNGVKADLGASAQKLSAGDAVEWKYEK